MTTNVLPDAIRTLLGVATARPELGSDNPLLPDIKTYLNDPGGPHYFQAQAGLDVMTGGTGSDYFEGGIGADVFADLGPNGGGNTDTLGYFNSDAGVNVTLSAAGGIQSASGGAAAGDTSLANFENLVGSTFADTLTGNGLNNILVGMGGTDTLNGNNGNDILNGGNAGDQLNGGNGSDTADYSSSNVAVDINLRTGAASGGEAAGDHFNSIENVTGSAFDDRLRGNTANNILNGGNGNDTLIAPTGSAQVSGNDTLIGGEGNDTFVTPIVPFRDAPQPTTIMVGGAGQDTYTVIVLLGATEIYTFNDISEFQDEVLPVFENTRDRVDLRGVDASQSAAGNQAFNFIGTRVFTGTEGELQCAQADSAHWNVYGDVTGDGQADFHFQIGQTAAPTSDVFML